MKYDIDKECKKLLEKLNRRDKEEVKRLKEIFSLVAQNIANIVTVDPNTETYRYIDRLLGVVIEKDNEGESRIKKACELVLAQDKREPMLAEKLATIAQSMQNLWNLFNKIDTIFPQYKEVFDENVHQIIVDHIYEISERYENEKSEKYKILLAKAAKSDLKALIGSGQRIELKDQETFQIAEKIKNNLI